MPRYDRKKALRKRRIFITLCVLVLALIIALISFAISTVNKALKNNQENENESSYSESESEKPKKTERTLVSTATVINTGDIMVHSTQLDGAKTSNGYDFSAFFKNIKSYVTAADYSIANLELTFGGTESGAYSGYPAFNTPDCFANTIKDAGFDFLVTTNNHSYDTGLFGLKRTVSVINKAGFSHIGTKENPSDKSYDVKKINGIKFGITAYTYENQCTAQGRKSINGNVISAEANDLINSFNYDRIEEFYKTAESNINDMKKSGADVIVFYMHWGEEYHTKENVWQTKIAQKLCDLGVDIIVGSHPHVIEPVSLLTSQDGTRKTVCVYSMGNAISNQRQEIMHPECPTGHTEDGMLLYYTFNKYSDGSVSLASVDIIPTWVDKYKGGSGYLYSIVPLESRESGANFGLSPTSLEKSKRSYDRTKEIIGAGLTEIQNAVGCKVRFN